ncbi:MAG: hypothetical protein ACI9W4_001988, partial [Rhodothermales bacterium]
MRTGANLISGLIFFTLAVALSACGLFGAGDKSAEQTAAGRLDSVSQIARADSLSMVAVDSVSPAAIDSLTTAAADSPPANTALAGVAAAAKVTPGPTTISADSLARAVTALVLQQLQGRLADTVVVRIDTVRAASA